MLPTVTLQHILAFDQLQTLLTLCFNIIYAVLYIDYKWISLCSALSDSLVCLSLTVLQSSSFSCALLQWLIASLCPVGFNVSHLVFSFSIHLFFFSLSHTFFICPVLSSRLRCFQELHGVRICYYLLPLYLPEYECMFVWIRNRSTSATHLQDLWDCTSVDHDWAWILKLNTLQQVNKLLANCSLFNLYS